MDRDEATLLLLLLLLLSVVCFYQLLYVSVCVASLNCTANGFLHAQIVVS